MSSPLEEMPDSPTLEAIDEVCTEGAPMSCHIARKVVQFLHEAGPSPELLENLSPRETEILELLVTGSFFKAAFRAALAPETWVNLSATGDWSFRFWSQKDLVYMVAAGAPAKRLAELGHPAFVRQRDESPPRNRASLAEHLIQTIDIDAVSRAAQKLQRWATTV